jgi:zinc/manganese transport system substrate-binding protein
MIPLRTPSAGPVIPKTSRFCRNAVVATSLVLVGVTLSSCGSPAAVSSGVIRAVGAENQYANVLAQIGGRYVSVRAIMSNPSTDPHTFEVSTSVAQLISTAQLVVQNGVGYDAFMNQLEAASPSSSRDVIDVQTLEGLSNNTKNPHLWYKPSTMPRVAKAIAVDLTKLQPGHARYFATRLSAFSKSVNSLTVAVATFKKKYKGVRVATTEPVADYLLQALGLLNVTPFRFQADVMNGIDPSPEDIAFQQGLLTHRKVRVFLYNEQVSSPVTVSLQSLAKSSGVPIVAVYETMPTPGYDYQSWMLAEIAALTRALSTSRSTVRI